MSRLCRGCGKAFEPSRDYHHSCWDCWRADQLSAPPDAAAQVRLENQRLRSEVERLRALADQPKLGLDVATLRALVQLTHPDKHDGSPLAVRITQKLLQLRAAL